MSADTPATAEIWFNPSCSKCRTAKSALDAAGADYVVRRYLDDPPTVAELDDLLERLGLEPWAVTRLADPPARDLGLKDLPRDAAHRTRWIEILAANPRLIQRPIVTIPGGGAVVARDDATLTTVLDRLRGA